MCVISRLVRAAAPNFPGAYSEESHSVNVNLSNIPHVIKFAWEKGRLPATHVPGNETVANRQFVTSGHGALPNSETAERNTKEDVYLL